MPSFLRAPLMSDFSIKRMSTSGDPLADIVALRLDRRRPSNMMDEVHYLAKTEIGIYQELIDHLYCVPNWVDWQQIEHARRVQSTFSHARSIATLTGSLIEGYCQNRALLAMVMRGHLNQEVVRRVHETNQIIHSVDQTNTLKPGGHCHRTLSEVRLSNAMLRKGLLARNWAEHHKDTPLSQLDMAFDMLEFGYIATQGMERLGITLQEDDKQAIHHFWRYAAYVYGVDEDLLTENLEQEASLYTQLSQRNKTIRKEHQLMSRTTLDGLANDVALNLPPAMIHEFSRVCLGKEKADRLNIPEHSQWKRRINFYITANRGATFMYYRIPGMSGINARVNNYVSRNMLIAPQEQRSKQVDRKPQFKQSA